MSRQYFVVLILSYHYALSSACSCRESPSISQHVCDHQVAAKVKVIEELPDSTSKNVDLSSIDSDGVVNNLGDFSGALSQTANDVAPLRTFHQRKSDRVYRLKYLKVYRNETNHELNTSVYTAPSPSVCGIRFLDGKEYLLFANVHHNMLRTGLCSGNLIWSMLNSSQIHDLENSRCSENHNGKSTTRYRNSTRHTTRRTPTTRITTRHPVLRRG